MRANLCFLGSSGISSFSDWLCKIWYISFFLYKFDTVLYQFLKTGTSNRTLMGLDQLLRYLLL